MKYNVLCASHHYVNYVVEAKDEEEAKEKALEGDYIEVEEDQFYRPDEFKVENVEKVKWI